MKRIEPVLRRHFRKLERTEAEAQAEAMRAYDGLVSQAMGIILKYIANADGTPRSPQERLKGNLSRHLMAGARLAGLTVQGFDELHTMTVAEALRTELRIIQIRQAEAAYKSITDSMSEQAEDLWEALAAHLSAPHLKIRAEDLERIIRDETYPIRETLRANHEAIANRLSRRIWQAQAQGEDALAITTEAADYMRKTTKEAFSIVEYYEDTRIAAEVALDVLADVGEEYFRTVCVHDGKACPVCRKIEAAQMANPVRISDAVTGLNRPPFHPFCRCCVEVA